MQNIDEMNFSLIKKAFSYQSGALAIIATPLSIAWNELFSLVFNNTQGRDLALPFLISGTLLTAYFIVSIFDFYTGLMASRKEHIKEFGTARGYIKSDKLWSSIWKFFAVILIGFLLLIFCIIFIAIENGLMSSLFLYGITFFYIVIMLFDIHSIGENQERRFGKKPHIFLFLEEVSKAVRRAFIRRIEKTISGENNEPADHP